MREWTFFWQNMGLRGVYILEIWRFCQNMGIWAVIFSFKIGKKEVPIDFFWPILYRSFERIDFIFDQIWAWKQGFFHVILQKNDMRTPRFWESGCFFDKIWEWGQSLFREWKFFDKIWACHRSIDFFVTLTFLAHNIR